MYKPRPLKDLRHEAELFWIFVQDQWRMASIIWRRGMPTAVSFGPSAVINSWEACRDLPAIAIAG